MKFESRFLCETYDTRFLGLFKSLSVESHFVPCFIN